MAHGLARALRYRFLNENGDGGAGGSMGSGDSGAGIGSGADGNTGNAAEGLDSSPNQDGGASDASGTGNRGIAGEGADSSPGGAEQSFDDLYAEALSQRVGMSFFDGVKIAGKLAANVSSLAMGGLPAVLGAISIADTARSSGMFSGLQTSGAPSSSSLGFGGSDSYAGLNSVTRSTGNALNFSQFSDAQIAAMKPGEIVNMSASPVPVSGLAPEVVVVPSTNLTDPSSGGVSKPIDWVSIIGVGATLAALFKGG